MLLSSRRRLARRVRVFAGRLPPLPPDSGQRAVDWATDTLFDVRAGSSWSPLTSPTVSDYWDIPQGGTVFEDTARTVPAGVGSLVAGLASSKGGDHFSQASSGLRPTLITDPDLESPVLSFDGSRYLIATGAAGARMQGVHTAVLAAKPLAEGIGVVISASRNAASEEFVSIGFNGPTVRYRRFRDFNTNLYDRGASPLGSWAVITATWRQVSGSNYEVWLRRNGLNIGGGAANVTLSCQRLTLGAEFNDAADTFRLFFTGSLAAVIIMSDASITREVIDAERFLASRVGVSLA